VVILGEVGALPCGAALLLGLALAAPAALAAPEEIQVYLDDLTTPGRFGLDVHNNYAVSASTTPDYEGARPPDHVYRFTPEFYYGLTPSLELGLYVLTAVDRSNEWHADGAKLRLKYIAPHEATQGAFWGLNLEVGQSDRAVAEQPWNYELKGIFGERFGRWLVAFNLDVDGALSSHAGPAGVALDTRLGYAISDRTQVALEAYDELGALTSPGGLRDLGQMLYLVVDTDLKVCDLNFGLGRGLTAASDGWVVKAIFGFHF
jgi:hypothetical protein